MTGPLPIECSRYEEDWSALLDGELSPEREVQLRDHAARCARCTAKLASLARVDVLLAGLPVRETNADLFARVRSRIDAQDARAADPVPARRAPPPDRRWRARGLVAAAVAAAAALALYLALPRLDAPLAPAPELRVARAPQPEPAPPVLPEPAPLPQPSPAEPALVAETRELDIDALPAEELAVGLDLDTARDLDVIANLELLEAWVALEEGRG